MPNVVHYLRAIRRRGFTERNGMAASLISYILIGHTMINPYVSNWTSRAKRCGAICGGYQVDLQVVAEKKSSSERIIATKMRNWDPAIGAVLKYILILRHVLYSSTFVSTLYSPKIIRIFSAKKFQYFLY